MDVNVVIVMEDADQDVTMAIEEEDNAVNCIIATHMDGLITQVLIASIQVKLTNLLQHWKIEWVVVWKDYLLGTNDK